MTDVQPARTPVRSRRGEETRERLLELAEASVLRKGFGATSIDELIHEAGLTKSGFFYHFKDKADLGKALLKRYIEADDRILDDIFARADAGSDAPLERMLTALGFFAEMMAELPTAHPGCLVAAYTYQDQLMNAEIRAMSVEAILTWRRRFLQRLEAIAAERPPRDSVDLGALADMITVTVEGGIILSKALHDPKLLAEQILLFRSYVKLLFSPAAG